MDSLISLNSNVKIINRTKDILLWEGHNEVRDRYMDRLIGGLINGLSPYQVDVEHLIDNYDTDGTGSESGKSGITLYGIPGDYRGMETTYTTDIPNYKVTYFGDFVSDVDIEVSQLNLVDTFDGTNNSSIAFVDKSSSPLNLNADQFYEVQWSMSFSK